MKYLRITNSITINLENVKHIYKKETYIAFDDIKINYSNYELRDKDFEEIMKIIGAKDL